MAKISPERWRVVSPYLDAVLDVAEAERPAWLAALRLRDDLLADELVQLLARHEALRDRQFLEQDIIRGAGGLLDGGADDSPTTGAACAAAAAEDRAAHGLAGRTLGAYTLVSPIGEGGMGAVWLARRSDGRFEGRAAVKLLKLARLGRAGEERFAREGTILARLTHPGIAHLIDAGVSSDGWPFLVLEYVDGQPLDRHCDAQTLSVPARIRLLLDVCDAIAHAHANLVVHRDIKPSNVLITTAGQVKLLDFGIAKLLDPAEAPEIDQTAPLPLTREFGVGMTPEYAAPEQLSGGSIATTTDVFALGVLMFVLFTGQHPYDAGERRSPAELFRAILDLEPPRPSGVVADARRRTPEELAANAAVRASTPERLARLLTGDLDTIVGKALKKDPAQRYPSVLMLADDLRRYLADEPIAARPDALTYRMGKFVRRHARAVTATALVVLTLLGIIGFYTLRVAAERDRARYEAQKSAKVIDLLTQLLTGADPFADKREPTVRAVLDSATGRMSTDLAGEPALQAEILPVLGRIYQRLGAFDQAQGLLDRAVGLSRDLLRAGQGEPGQAEQWLAGSLTEQGVLRRERGDAAGSVPLFTEAIALYRPRAAAQPLSLAKALNELARSEMHLGRLDAAEAHVREALEIRRRTQGPEHGDIGSPLTDLAGILREKGDMPGAEAFVRQALAVARKAYGPRHAKTAVGLNNLAVMVAERKDYAEVERLLRESLEITREVYGSRHALIANLLANIGQAVFLQGRLAEARTLLEESVRMGADLPGVRHLSLANNRVMYAQILLAQHDDAAAEAVLRQVIAVYAERLPADHWRTGVARGLLGEALLRQQRLPEAETVLLQAAAVLKDIPGDQGEEARATRKRLAALYDAWGRPAEAARYR